jgi:hypothetical protein
MLTIDRNMLARAVRPGVRLAVAGTLVIASLCAYAAQAAPRLEASPLQSNDGVTQLRWDLQGDAAELQRATSPAFTDATTLYRGTDSASLRSGLADGSYFYRVRRLPGDGVAGEWSAPVQVRVAHHSPQRAWGVFATGAVVFLATLALILFGGRREAGHD